MDKNVPSIRLARYQLAQALWADHQSAEAIEQLDRLLSDHGSEPRDSIAFALLSEWHTAQGDFSGAIESAVLAVVNDPGDPVGLQRALVLIERHPAEATSMAESILQRLESTARTTPEAVAAWRLAGELWFRRGNFDRALEALRQALADKSPTTLMRLAEVSIAAGRADEARDSLRQAAAGTPGMNEGARLRLLLARVEAETGRYAEAELSLPEGFTPDHHFVRALVAVGQNRADDALRELETVASVDASLLRSVVHISVDDFDEARAEALTAASENPSSTDALLVRAQVELESAVNLEEGRGLLERVFETTHQDLTKSRWLGLQRPFAKERAHFQYFLAEAADVSKSADTLELADAVDRSGTTYLQDGRLDHLRGNWLHEHGDIPAAVKAFGDASANFEEAESSIPAMDNAREAFELSRQGTTAARLIQAIWKASYSDDMADDERQRLLDEARRIVDDEHLAQEGAEETDAIVYFGGLVQLRKSELLDSEQQPAAWAALTELMAVALNKERDPYRARFVADALGTVGALGAATTFADRAFEWQSDDEMRETAAVARGRYCRGIAAFESLLAGFENLDRFGTWRELIAFHVRLNSGEHEGLADQLSQVEFDEPWARVTRATAIALLQSVERSTAMFEECAAEISQQNGAEDAAAEAWLLAGRPKKALRILEQGRQRQNVPEVGIVWWHALARLASGETNDMSNARIIDRMAPLEISAAFYCTLPIMRKLYETDSVRRAIDALLERLAPIVVAAPKSPAASDGLEYAPAQHRQLLFAMVALFESADSATGIREAVAHLLALKPSGRLGQVIQQACERLLARADAAGSTRGSEAALG